MFTFAQDDQVFDEPQETPVPSTVTAAPQTIIDLWSLTDTELRAKSRKLEDQLGKTILDGINLEYTLRQIEKTLSLRARQLTV